jgi:hypothetical protein
MPTLVAYNRQRAAEMLRCWTPQRLLDELQAGRYGAELETSEREELQALLQDWVYRALGLVTLRDALWVDPQRGERVYDLLCTTLTTAHVALAAGHASTLPDAGGDIPTQQVRDLLAQQPTARREPLATLVQQAEVDGLAFTWHYGSSTRYPFPDDLEHLLPPPPQPYNEPMVRFEQPTGWRRALAIVLVVLGVASLGVPLLAGSMPAQPAGLPLGLLTLGLLVGIRAGWPGSIGAFCIWLVPNLPTFHYGTSLAAFWPALPLLTLGMLLLGCDRHVRALWRWILRHPAR